MKVRGVDTVKYIAAVLVLVTFGSIGRAQFPEDALRFATPGIGVGARAIGMGGAYTGVANDFSAVFWNPAGLAQLEYGEFSLGLSHLAFNDKSTYIGTTRSYTNNATQLNALGLAFPVPVRRGSLVLALGYNRNSSFTTGVSFNAFNPSNSIIQTYNPDGVPVGGSPSGVAWELYLADTTRNTQGQVVYYSPIINRVTQIGKVLEGGGLNNWTAAGAIDIARNVSVGLSLNYVTGTYTYDRSYEERDDRNLYTSPINGSPLQFDRFTQDDFVESDLSAFNAKIGLMYRVLEKFRFGVAVRTPTSFRIKETFGSTYKAYFDNGDIVSPEPTNSSNEYDVVTPWVFSAGVSVMVKDLVLSGDIEYTDWTQLEFRNANPDVIALNKDIKDLFRATANLRAGAEYDVKDLGIRIRGGFIYNPSPFQGDPSSFDQKYITAGAGILLSENTTLDLTYARGWWKTFRYNYAGSPQLQEDITANNFALTFSYRY
ncbi:MAG TPA: outer membrane protein transport protein [Bacteroidota bacterium]|nr:outer membrane protein transport protein [Bacteroidota bacterium]